MFGYTKFNPEALVTDIEFYTYNFICIIEKYFKIHDLRRLSEVNETKNIQNKY